MGSKVTVFSNAGSVSPLEERVTTRAVSYTHLDESQMAKRPFFTWILVVPGAVLGVFIGMKVQEPVLGPVFGGIMGIAVGSLCLLYTSRRV